MGFLTKKLTACAMLGNPEVTNALVANKIFDDYGIKLINTDFVTVEELLKAVRVNRGTEYVLLSDSAFLGQENGIRDTIIQIREQDDDVCIVLFFNYSKPDDTFKNWAYGYKVYNIYCADVEGNYDFAQIMPELVKKQMPAAERAEKNMEQEEILTQKEQELLQKDEYIKKLEHDLQNLSRQKTEKNLPDKEAVLSLKQEIQKEKELRSLARTQLDEQKAHFEEEKQILIEAAEEEKRQYQERAAVEKKQLQSSMKAEIEAMKQNMQQTPLESLRRSFGCITIGVFSLSAGAGSTHTAHMLAESLERMGYHTAVVAYDGRSDLKHASGKADYFIPAAKEEKKISLLTAVNGGYTFVVIDFGCVFPLDPDGELIIGTDRQAGSREEADELIRCQYKVAMGFADPWHINKLNFLDRNELFDSSALLACIDEIEGKKGIDKLDVMVCEREDNVIQAALFEVIGLDRTTKKAEKKRLFNL